MELKESLQKKVEEFKKNYPVDERVKSRITQPSMAFYGTEILNRAVTALLEGENLLLCGDKATGKNILAENLPWISRRILDVPGYDRISLHPAARFIATMNYGYAGTKELNEALVSRFMVINMPSLTMERMYQILKNLFPSIRREAEEQFAGLFLDLQLKAQNGEISTKAVDMRGLIGALRMVRGGLTPLEAIDMGITNKTFDAFERELIGDLVMTRIPETWDGSDVFDE